MSEKFDEELFESFKIPPVPIVATRLIQAVDDPTCSATTLTRIISVDQAMASQVLKIANSAFYGCPRKVPNLALAIVILGFNTIKNLVISMSTRDVYDRHNRVTQTLWEHSLAVGVTSHVIARFLMVSQIDDTFICGLLHDIGKAVINQHDSKKYEAVIAKKYEGERTYIDKENEIFGFSHEDVGAFMVQKWNLPEELEQTIRFHHSEDPESEIDQPYLARLINIVKLADLICHRLDSQDAVNDEVFYEMAAPSMQALKLEKNQLENCLTRIEEALENEMSLMAL